MLIEHNYLVKIKTIASSLRIVLRPKRVSPEQIESHDNHDTKRKPHNEKEDHDHIDSKRVSHEEDNSNDDTGNGYIEEDDYSSSKKKNTTNNIMSLNKKKKGLDIILRLKCCHMRRNIITMILKTKRQNTMDYFHKKHKAYE